MKSFFKVLLAGVFAICTVCVANAQYYTGSSTAADTTVDAGSQSIVFHMTSGNLKSIEAYVTKVSGTVAGTVILQGSNDGSHYFAVDTLTLSDVATNQVHWSFTSTEYVYYKILHTGSGTQQSILSANYLRRNDD